jgi:hypothetical protein
MSLASFARTLGLTGSDAYRQWWQSIRPAYLPSNLATTYAKDGFTTWPDFLQSPADLHPTASPVS